MRRILTIQVFYLILLAGLVGLSLVYAQPDVALVRVLTRGPLQAVSIMTVMTAALYLAALAPAILIRTRSGLILAAGLVAIIAVVPRGLAGYAAAQNRAMAGQTDMAATPAPGPIRVVDLHNLPCRELCAALLATDRIEAVRVSNDYDVVEVFITGAGGPSRVPDTYGPGDITLSVQLLDPYDLRHDWGMTSRWFAEPASATRVRVTTGGHAERDTAPTLYQRTDVSHALPAVPTRVQAPLTGWTSGGNRGGVTLVQINDWRHGPDAVDQAQILRDIGIDLNLSGR